MSNEKFGLVKTATLQDPELSLRAKGLYALLCTFANRQGECYPSVATLAESSGVSKRTVERIVKELQQTGYLTRKGRKFYLKDRTKVRGRSAGDKG